MNDVMKRAPNKERIDQRIIRELDQCHAAVADLTFARPSVYWEAGYIEGRGVPVVHTCRDDHFSARADDKFGNFRVHFDVQTANIIRWRDANDRAFGSALEARLRHVLRPTLRDRTREEQQRALRLQFAALSLATRRQRLVDLAIRQARPRGFSAKKIDFDVKDALTEPRWFAVAQGAVRLEHDTQHVAHTAIVFALSRVTQGQWGTIRAYTAARWIDLDRARRAAIGRKVAVDHAIVLSLEPVTPGVVDRVFSQYSREASGPVLKWARSVRVEELPGHDPIQRSVNVWAARVQSEQETRLVLAHILGHLTQGTVKS